MSKTARIVVIGAGAAGISATHSLLQKGFRNVILLEALGRIGGRIHTYQWIDGKPPIELGANWIHQNSKKNSMIKLAKEKSIKLVGYGDSMKEMCMKENGEEIPRKIVRKAEKIFDKYQDKMWDSSDDESEEPKVDIMQYYLTNHEKELEKIPQEQRDDVRRALNSFLNYGVVMEGDELRKITSEQRKGKELPGGDSLVPGGYIQLLRALVDEFPEDVLRLNSEVQEISWEEEGSFCVSVKCKSGVALQADHVIVTTSIGYLKCNHERLFRPPLPEAKVEVIDKFGFGKVNKIFLQFSEPIVDQSVSALLLCRASLECKEWHDRIFGFDTFPNHPNMLLGWVAGDGVDTMEKLPEKEITNECMKLLQKFLKRDNLPMPEKVLVTRWCSDPFFCGSYSHPAMGSRPDEIQILQEPVSNKKGIPKILFAGEATSEQFFATTHGARDSGLREADRLGKLYTS